MSNVLNVPNSLVAANRARVYSTATLAELLHRLGGLPPERVRLDPPPGQATRDDLIQVNEQHNGPICEWVENTLVEKAVGQHESWLTTILIGELYHYLQAHDIGMLLGPDGVLEILPGIGRAPDVSFLAWNSLPEGKPPSRFDKVPAVVPNLVIEVLSESNRPGEMARKRSEYFRAGVERVWEIDPRSRTAQVYTGPESSVDVLEDGLIAGETILPGFVLSLRNVFDRALRRN